MDVLGFVFGMSGISLGVIALGLVQNASNKLTEVQADLQSVKEELAKLQSQLGQNNATS